MHVNGNFEGFLRKIVLCSGWCHINDPCFQGRERSGGATSQVSISSTLVTLRS